MHTPPEVPTLSLTANIPELSTSLPCFFSLVGDKSWPSGSWGGLCSGAPSTTEVPSQVPRCLSTCLSALLPPPPPPVVPLAPQLSCGGG